MSVRFTGAEAAAAALFVFAIAVCVAAKALGESPRLMARQSL